MRGRIWIHTGVHRVTKAEYKQFVEDCEAVGIRKIPKIGDFETGGIVGSVEIVDCVTKSKSFWFQGKYGFVLKDARTCRLRPMPGKLGFFEV